MLTFRLCTFGSSDGLPECFPSFTGSLKGTPEVVCTASGETGASERRLTFTLRTSLEMFSLRAEYLRGGVYSFQKTL